MTRPVCTDATCDRSVVRYRDGAGYCLFHPDAQPPVLDPKTGRPVSPTPIKRAAPKTLQAELDELERTDPVVAAAAASYDAMVDKVLSRPTPTTPTKGDVPDHATELGEVSRQAAATKAHDGADSHDVGPVTCETTPDPRKGRQGAQPTLPAPRARAGRRPNPFDPQEAARRYLDGEGLFPLAADLHVGVKTLREALAAEGVELRKRGDVIGARGPAPTPIDADECQRLYATGLNTTQIARQLRVKTNRVQNLLRELGVLRPPGGRPPGAAALNAVRLKLTREESAAVRLRAAQLGQPINHYLRRLVLADLAPTSGDEEEVA